LLTVQAPGHFTFEDSIEKLFKLKQRVDEGRGYLGGSKNQSQDDQGKNRDTQEP